MKFIGSKELLILYRIKRNGTVQLKIKKGFQSGKDFVVLVQLADYYNFITDNEHQLKRYFFEENVRDYLGNNRTNTDIMNTLEAQDEIDFWNLIERRRDFIYDDYQIDEEFIETVKEMLPAQPWPVGIHKTIASQLGCTNAKVSRTIEALIDTGVFKKQINGHVISNEQNLP